jgi:biopolymer transport protein ExbD
MQTHAIKIDTGHGTPPIVQPPTIQLGIDFDGTTTWNGTPVDHATLDAYLANAAAKDPQPNIVIRADNLAKYDTVARVLADAAAAGETHVGFAQDP